MTDVSRSQNQPVYKMFKLAEYLQENYCMIYKKIINVLTCNDQIGVLLEMKII